MGQAKSRPVRVIKRGIFGILGIPLVEPPILIQANAALAGDGQCCTGLVARSGRRERWDSCK